MTTTETRPLTPMAPDGPMFAISLDPSRTPGQLSIAGELDLATAPRVGDAFDLLTGLHRRTITVDLSGVRFCDCAGLGALIAAITTYTRHGGTATITATSRSVRRFTDRLPTPRWL